MVEATGVSISNTGSFLRSLCRLLGREVGGSVEMRAIVDMMGYGAKGAGRRVNMSEETSLIQLRWLMEGWRWCLEGGDRCRKGKRWVWLRRGRGVL